jgi:putative ABC transport system permease protein
VVNTVLARKLRRDLWRHRGQFAAVVVVLAIGVAVFIAASDAYRNLRDSFDRAYAGQRLPDVVLTGPGAPAVADAVGALPGRPFVDVRSEVDLGGRVGDHTLLTRVVSVPDGGQPAVASLSLRSGHLPGPGEVVAEQHLADHFGLSPGDSFELQTAHGWQRVTISGTGLSPEYFWPARSAQEIMTTADQFGVVFAPEGLADTLAGARADTRRLQVAAYARDRRQVDPLVAGARRVASSAGLVVSTRDDQPSYTALDQDVRTFGDFARFLPLLFLVAGTFGAFILLSRLVLAQRAVIGTLTANGIGARTLRRHYLAYGLVAGAGAALPGLAGGYWLGDWFTGMYTDALGLPLSVTSVHPQTLVVAAGAGILAAGLAAWGPARAAARIAPAEAMRAAPSGRGRRSLLEVVVPPLRRLPARWRMVVRGLGRNRRRTVFTVVGVALPLSLVMVFAGLRDTVSDVLDRQFTQVDLADGQLYVAPERAGTAVAGARAADGVARAEPFARYPAGLVHGARRYDTLLLALPANVTLHRFVDRDGKRLALSDSGGILAGEGLRTLLGLRVGDHVIVTLPDGARLSEPVAGFVDEPMTPVAYLSLARLDHVLGVSATNGALIRLDPGSDRDAVAHRLGALPGAAAYFDNAQSEKSMRSSFDLMDVLLGVMLAFAVVMAAALLFNAMSANLAERAVELGTLHAAGLARGTLARLVAVENLLLTVVGTPLGLLAGYYLARWFMAGYETEGYRWALRLDTQTVLLVIVGVAIAAVLAQLPVLRSLRRIDVAGIVRERSL